MHVFPMCCKGVLVPSSCLARQHAMAGVSPASAGPCRGLSMPSSVASGFSSPSTPFVVDEADDADVLGAAPPVIVGGGTSAVCCKCKLEVPLAELDHCSRDKMNLGKKGQLVCACCNLNYKAMARRWKSQAALRQWWQLKSEAEKAAWYIQHKEVVGAGAGRGSGGSGHMRIKMTVDEEHERSAGTELKKRRIWQCQSEWELEQCVRDPSFNFKTMEQKGAAWEQLLLGDRPKTKVDGQWCVAKFVGLIEDHVDRNMVKVCVKRRGVVESQDELHALQEHANDTLKKARQQEGDRFGLNVYRSDLADE